jgi:hypothetical protein
MYARPCRILKQALVQDNPRNRKITTAIKHPIAMFFAIVFPRPVPVGD